jgi:hypothetical protein
MTDKWRATRVMSRDLGGFRLGSFIINLRAKNPRQDETKRL